MIGVDSLCYVCETNAANVLGRMETTIGGTRCVAWAPLCGDCATRWSDTVTDDPSKVSRARGPLEDKAS